MPWDISYLCTCLHPIQIYSKCKIIKEPIFGGTVLSKSKILPARNQTTTLQTALRMYSFTFSPASYTQIFWYIYALNTSLCAVATSLLKFYPVYISFSETSISSLLSKDLHKYQNLLIPLRLTLHLTVSQPNQHECSLTNLTTTACLYYLLFKSHTSSVVESLASKYKTSSVI